MESVRCSVGEVWPAFALGGAGQVSSSQIGEQGFNYLQTGEQDFFWKYLKQTGEHGLKYLQIGEQGLKYLKIGEQGFNICNKLENKVSNIWSKLENEVSNICKNEKDWMIWTLVSRRAPVCVASSTVIGSPPWGGGYLFNGYTHT